MDPEGKYISKKPLEVGVSVSILGEIYCPGAEAIVYTGIELLSHVDDLNFFPITTCGTPETTRSDH